jgi:uncharacterized phage-associated protein
VTSRRLTFDFESEKFVSAACYLAERCPGLTKLKLFKLLYFADKEHLLAYGRPIIGDRYIKMDHGPVPSRAYNIVKHDDRAKPEERELFDDYLSVQGNDIRAISPPNLAYLAETDLEVLDQAIRTYGSLTPAQLSTLSHRDLAWQGADFNAEMDYRLVFADRAEAGEMERMVQEDQQVKDALADEEFEDRIALLRS